MQFLFYHGKGNLLFIIHGILSSIFTKRIILAQVDKVQANLFYIILNFFFWNIPPIQYVTKLLYPILNSNYVIGDINGHSFMATKISFVVALPLQIHFTLVLIFISFSFFSSNSLTPCNAFFKCSIVVILCGYYYLSFPTQLPTTLSIPFLCTCIIIPFKCNITYKT